MSRLLKNISVFLCFFAMFYLLVMFVTLCSTYFTAEVEKKLFVNTQAGGGNYYRIPDAELWLKDTSGTQPRGLLLGSSTVYRNINPYILSERTGINFFNQGSSNQTLEASYIILQEILKKYNHIDYMLLDVSPVLWQENIDGAAIDWGVNNRTPVSDIPFRMVLRCSSFKVKRLYLYNVFKRVVPIGKDQVVEGFFTTYYGKGWVRVNDNTPRENVENKVFSSISTANKEALLGILDLVNRHSIKLFVYISYPVKAKVDERVISDIVPEYFTSIGAGLSDSMYYDSHHMYENGINLNSEWIAQYINNHK